MDGAPFPELVWKRNGNTVEYTERVFVSGYDASLMFTTVTNDDGGVYSVSLTNNERSIESMSIALTVTGMLEVSGAVIVPLCNGIFRGYLCGWRTDRVT